MVSETNFKTIDANKDLIDKSEVAKEIDTTEAEIPLHNSDDKTITKKSELISEATIEKCNIKDDQENNQENRIPSKSISNGSVELSTNILKDDAIQEEKVEADTKIEKHDNTELNNKKEQDYTIEDAPYIRTSALTKKYCLVFDLDETLIHYKVDPNNPDEDEMLIRPFMFDCLTELSKNYELILWTAATEEVSDDL